MAEQTTFPLAEALKKLTTISFFNGPTVDAEFNEGVDPIETLKGLNFNSFLGESTAPDVPFIPEHKDFDKDLSSMETALSNIGDTPRNFMIQYEGNKTAVHDDGAGNPTIGVGHKLTVEELKTGIILIGGKEVEFKKGITNIQMNTLFEEDFFPRWKVAGELITRAKLDHVPNLQTALASLLFNTSSKQNPEAGFLKIAPLAHAALMRGDLEAFKVEVFDPIRGIVKSKGKILRGLVNRRQAELALLDPYRGVERIEIGPVGVFGGPMDAEDFRSTATESKWNPEEAALGDEVIGDLPTEKSAKEFSSQMGSLANALNPLTGAKEAYAGSAEIMESFKNRDFGKLMQGLSMMAVGILGTIGGPPGKAGKAGKAGLRVIKGGKSKAAAIDDSVDLKTLGPRDAELKIREFIERAETGDTFAASRALTARQKIKPPPRLSYDPSAPGAKDLPFPQTPLDGLDRTLASTGVKIEGTETILKWDLPSERAFLLDKDGKQIAEIFDINILSEGGTVGREATEIAFTGEKRELLTSFDNLKEKILTARIKKTSKILPIKKTPKEAVKDINNQLKVTRDVETRGKLLDKRYKLDPDGKLNYELVKENMEPVLKEADDIARIKAQERKELLDEAADIIERKLKEADKAKLKKALKLIEGGKDK